MSQCLLPLLKPQQPQNVHCAVIDEQASFSVSQAVDYKLQGWPCGPFLRQQHGIINTVVIYNTNGYHSKAVCTSAC